MPRTPDDIPGYLAALPHLAHIDPIPLRGRRILLDPGHGGFFRGAIGHQGLTESEINLGVALYLQGMLQWAGADVHLTRTADVDFLTPADSSLTADLAARVAICDSLAPDVFLSIHHNSTADRDPTVNETQTYYPLGREGADLDLARAIHRRLVLTLQIEPAMILPGNFYVLRNVSVPAVLGEPAMLSNPVIEGRLSLARSLELEAGAYFQGLLDYFAAGTPRWFTALPDTIKMDPMPGPLVWVYEAGSPRCPALDPTTISVTVDGLPLPFHLDPAAGTVLVLPSQLQGGVRLELSARNLAGRATPMRRHLLDHRRSGPWQTSIIVDGGGPSPRRALFTYHNMGQDLSDGGELRLWTPSPADCFSAPIDITALNSASVHQLPIFPGPRGWLLLDIPEFQAPGTPVADGLSGWCILERQEDDRWLIHDESAPILEVLPPAHRWLTLACDPSVWPDRSVPGDGWRYRIPPIGGEISESSVSPFMNPLWPVLAHVPGRPLWIEARGARPLIHIGDDHRAADARLDTLFWQPLLPAMAGVRVALDPQGGGHQEQGRGPFGTRGSDLNLMIAQRVSALLRGAGCEVLMLRSDDSWMPDQEKVRRADLFEADFYLAIGRGQPGVRHHPGSILGAPWARHSAKSLGRLLPQEVRVIGAHNYVLRHTACPALMVLLEAPTTAAIEDRLVSAAWQDAVARTLFSAMAALLQPEAAMLDINLILDSLEGHPFDDRIQCYAILDGNFLWLPPGRRDDRSLDSWQNHDPGLPGLGGQHILELHCGPHWQLWFLDRTAQGAWHGQLRLENR